MAVNQKAVKVINKILDTGFTDEKEILYGGFRRI